MSPRIDITAIRRDQIIDAARQIIVAEGINAVTIARIAEQADVSRGVVTYHFTDKQEILHDVLKAAMHDANVASKTLMAPGSSDDLAAMAQRVADLADSENDWWHIYVAFLDRSTTDDFYRRELAWITRHYIGALTKTFGSHSRAVIVMALLQGLAIQRLADSELSLDNVGNEMAELFRPWRDRAVAVGDEKGAIA